MKKKVLRSEVSGEFHFATIYDTGNDMCIVMTFMFKYHYDTIRYRVVF